MLTGNIASQAGRVAELEDGTLCLEKEQQGLLMGLLHLRAHNNKPGRDKPREDPLAMLVVTVVIRSGCSNVVILERNDMLARIAAIQMSPLHGVGRLGGGAACDAGRVRPDEGGL